METPQQTITMCPFCHHAKWAESPTHLCGPHEPVLIVASKYGFTKDSYDFPAHTAEFYKIRAQARLEVIKLRETSEHYARWRKNEKPRCRCKLCKQTKGFHFYVTKDGKQVRYQRNHGELPQ